MYDLPDKPTHPDAIDLWPIVVPLIERLDLAGAEVGYYYPTLSIRFVRISDYLAELMVDAELGILSAVPERQALKHEEKLSFKRAHRSGRQK